jgi:hypothetical protein
MKKKHYTLNLYPLPFTSNPYRKFCWPWWKEYINLKNYYRAVKYFCQRGYRGYADCDSWDADSYLESVILGVIKNLKENSHGYPMSMADYKMDEELPEGVEDMGYEKWKAVLQEIISGLEASNELRNEDTVLPGTYSDEPIEFEDIPDKPGFTKLKETDIPRFNKDLYEQWAEPLRKKKKRAMLLLCKHWGSFWD